MEKHSTDALIAYPSYRALLAELRASRTRVVDREAVAGVREKPPLSRFAPPSYPPSPSSPASMRARGGVH